MVIIYAIDCEIPFFGMRFYVGSTKGKLNKRMREHRCLLRQGKHQCSKLQEHWNKWGADSFRSRVLEFLSDDLSVRRNAELKWMDLYAKDGTLYNEHRISMRPTDEAIRKGVANAHLKPGNRWTPEANEKRRIAQLGKPKGHGAKISATKRAKREQVMR
jgi:hypothetical protein